MTAISLRIRAVSDSVNNIYLNGIEIRLGGLGRLEAKMNALDTLIHSMSVQKLESLEYIDISLPDEPVMMERPLGDDGTEEEGEIDDTASSDVKSSETPTDNRRDTTEAE